MEMLKNSILVDARLFPKVDKVTILECGQFMTSKLKGEYVEGRTLRLDTAYISWDGTSILGKIPQLLMALVIPHRPGLTLLHQYLGSEAQNFTHVILDPEQPGIVTLIGPRALPRDLPEGLSMVSVAEALEPQNFDQLHGTTRAVVGMMKFIQFKEYLAATEESLFSLNVGWTLRKVSEINGPVFTLERHAPAVSDVLPQHAVHTGLNLQRVGRLGAGAGVADEFGVETATDPLTERAALEEQGAKEMLETDDPYRNNVVLLLHIEGDNGTQVFTDEKARQEERVNGENGW